MSARVYVRWIVLGLFVALLGCQGELKLATTVADLQVLHGSVQLGGAAARGVARVPDGAAIETDEQGRARLRLDDGSALVVAGATKLGVASGRAKLESGRLFVLGAEGVRSEIEIGKAVVVLTGSHAAITRPARAPGTASVYAASGELTVRVGDKDYPVRTGESAAVADAAVTVAPERAFDDWTGGLAVPWGAEGKPRRTVGELWGRAPSAAPGDIGSPLTIRAETVAVRVLPDAAETEVKMVFFHSGSAAVLGDFRMALPLDAVVSGFALGQGDALFEGRVLLATREDAKPEASGPASRAVLEWAGDGWVRGSLPGIQPGAVVTVVVRYTEWLTPRPTADGQAVMVQYRLPLVGESEPPIIGEFSARLDAAAAKPLAAAAGLGARVNGSIVELRKSDFHPSADWVVELALTPPTAPARLNVAPAAPGDDNGSYVLARAEAPTAKAEEGVSLVLLLDASASVDAEMFDAERAFVDGLARALGPRDRLLVLAMDQTTRPVGPATIGPVDGARQQAILAALASLEPAGATDLGHALESAADAMDAKRPDAMLVYVGDGWPTMGDLGPSDIRARLGRRAAGMPRLGAVAVGPVARRGWLAGLVRGSGPLLELGDRSSAATAVAALMARALQPTVGAVELSLGSAVDQIYPLGPRAVEAGSTVYAIGRLRGAAPSAVTLRWRDAEGAHESRLPVLQQAALGSAELARRWARARVEELALRASGREAVTEVALRSQLLTPWTAWVVGGRPGETYGATPLGARALDLSPAGDGVLSAVLGSHGLGISALVDLSQGTDLGTAAPERAGRDVEGGLEQAVQAAARRAIEEASDNVRACRDSRAALRPDLAGMIQVRFELDGGGQASGIKIDGDRSTYDDALYRCLASVVVGLRYPATGAKTTIKVSATLELPAARGAERTKCSATATLPVPLRRGVWLQRLGGQRAAEVYLEAKRACELGDWTARRALLELVLDRVLGADRVTLGRTLDHAGERDAAAFLRREALRRARTPGELREVRSALLNDEQYPIAVFEKQYGEAKGDEQRMAVVRRFLELAPHDVRLGRQLLFLLEALGRKDALRQEIARIRRDPFADASLLAECASLLHRAGDDAGARQAFGEIVERAPHDPWARAFAGDRLRNEGWFEDASAAYGALEQQLGSEPLVLLRVALAHAGAGRLDLAGRVLANLTRVEGRDEGGQLSSVATDLAAILLIERGLGPGTEPKSAPGPEQKAELERRALELPRRERGGSLLLRLPAASAAIEVVLERGPKDAREQRRPTVAIPELGIYRFALGPEDLAGVTLRVTVPKQLAPARALGSAIDTVTWTGRAELPAVRTQPLELRPSGKVLELSWHDGSWQ